MDSTVSAPMVANVPKECPQCASNGVKSAVKLYQLSFEEATALCENSDCIFPLESGGIVIPSVLNGPNGQLSNKNMMSSPKRVEAAVSAATSATVSSATITSANYNWHSTVSTPVYQPTQLPPKAPSGFTWPSPPSSTQTSPALSVISASDKEVEFALGNKHCQTFDRLTPSPSPLPKEPSDDIDSFLNDLTSGFTSSSSTCSSNNFADEFPEIFGASVVENSCNSSVNSTHCSPIGTSIACNPSDSMGLTPEELESLSTCQGGTTLDGDKPARIAQTTLVHSKSTINPSPSGSNNNVRVMRLTKITSLPNGVKPLPLPTAIKSNVTTAPSIGTITSPAAAHTGVKRVIRISHNGSAKKIRIGSKVVDLTNSATSRAQRVPAISAPVPSSSPSPAPPPVQNQAPKPQVALQLSSDGTPVFTVQPLAVPVQVAATPKKVGTPNRRPRAKTAEKPPGTAKVCAEQQRKPRSKTRRSIDDEFDVDSIVSKFVQQANNRKIAAK